MILGVGIDIVDNANFRSRLNDELVAELFLPDEIAYARTQSRSWESFAVRMAAKEAAFKALGAGLSQGLRFRDVEVRRQESGVVSLVFHGRAKELAESKGVTASFVTLSHDGAGSVAVVVVEGDRP